MGTKMGEEIQFKTNKYRITRLEEHHVEQILELCQGNPLYYHYYKEKPTIENILYSMKALPPGSKMKDKYFLGFFMEKELVAILDLVRGYPNEKTAYIGWFMMNSKFQGMGLGTEIIEEIVAWIQNMGSTRIELAYIKDNQQAKHFWVKNDFKQIGQEVPMEQYTIMKMERMI